MVCNSPMPPMPAACPEAVWGPVRPTKLIARQPVSARQAFRSEACRLMDGFPCCKCRLGLGISAGLRLSQHVESELSRFGNCPPTHRSHPAPRREAQFSRGRRDWWCALGCVSFGPEALASCIATSLEPWRVRSMTIGPDDECCKRTRRVGRVASAALPRYLAREGRRQARVVHRDRPRLPHRAR